MKIYLAARYSRRAEMQDVAKRLESIGHTIVSRWIDGRHDSVPDRECAEDDLRDCRSADCTISFTEQPRTATRGARHVEFGIALAMNQLLYIVGPREHVFHYLEDVGTPCESVDALIEEILSPEGFEEAQACEAERLSRPTDNFIGG